VVKSFIHPILLSCFILTAPVLKAQKDEAAKCPAPAIKRMLDLYHCNPRPLDGSFVNDLIDDFIQTLDPDHLYFMNADVVQIKNSRGLVEDEILGRNHEFLNNLLGLYKARLAKADSTVSELLQAPFDFSSKEYLEMPTDSSGYADGETEYRKHWAKWLKYETLGRLAEVASYDSTKSKGEILAQQKAQELVVRKIEQRRIRRILEHPWGYETYIVSLFCNSLAAAYDPHSEFLPLAEKENFVGEVSGEAYSFGMMLNETERGEVEIMRMAPGSPAWKCGELNNHDVLLQMQWEGKAPVDLAGADVDEVVELLSDLNHQSVILTVRNESGTEKTVSLTKEKIQEETNFVKSFMLKGVKKIGYISLPAFYTEWETPGGPGCASDVAKEILKLKKRKMAGLVLDIRGNGGGSIEEALELAGLFIKQAPLTIIREKDGVAKPLHAPNTTVAYGGPLLVLVDGESASASELVAAAFQDYHRAIIAGSPTFGKASMQQVLPVDTNTSLNSAQLYSNVNDSKYDFLKITIGRLYRVTGKSLQTTGLQPDILLHDPGEVSMLKEASFKHALKPDSILLSRNISVQKPLPLKMLNDRSKNRTDTAGIFQIAEKYGQLISEMADDEKKPLSLEYDDYMALDKKYYLGAKQLKNMLEKDSTLTFKVANNGTDKRKLKPDKSRKEFNGHIIHNITHDIYIREAYSILSDYINSEK
jgi:carboxyl-terminal processing protease